MLSESVDGIELLRFARLSDVPGVAHAITVKPANMACHCGPGTEAAPEARRRVCEAMGLSFEHLTCAEQVHGNRIAVVDESLAGAGRAGRAEAVHGVDGLLTDVPGVPLMLLSADCPLIVVADPHRPAVGVAHAGWRGTVRRIAHRLCERMVDTFGSDPAELRAGVGPSAGPERYVVDEKVWGAAAESLRGAGKYFRQTPRGMTFDLWAANRDLLLEAGVSTDHIEVACTCTIQDARFFSYRREGPGTGRFALVAGLRRS
jgi:YfiH family protein